MDHNTLSPDSNGFWDEDHGEDWGSPWNHSDAVLNGVLEDVTEIEVVIINPLNPGT